MKGYLQIFAFIVIILGLFLYSYIITNHDKNFKSWCKEHNYTYVSHEVHYYIYDTPFNYLGKGQHIYELKFKDTNNKAHTYWVRTNMWNDTIKE